MSGRLRNWGTGPHWMDTSWPSQLPIQSHVKHHLEIAHLISTFLWWDRFFLVWVVPNPLFQKGSIVLGPQSMTLSPGRPPAHFNTFPVEGASAINDHHCDIFWGSCGGQTFLLPGAMSRRPTGRLPDTGWNIYGSLSGIDTCPINEIFLRDNDSIIPKDASCDGGKIQGFYKRIRGTSGLQEKPTLSWLF